VLEGRHGGGTAPRGRHTLTKDAIIAFAREYDPQPFHLDEEAGKRSLFGGLSASGWHTAALYIRGIVTSRLAEEAGRQSRAAYGPSPGFKDLRWPKPVFVDDTVEFKMRLTDKVDLKSRPDRGLLVSKVQGRNQHGDIVFEIDAQIFVERRAPYKPG
jgi:acyl dehydratase